MVGISVNVQKGYSFETYKLAEGSSIIDLKAEIKQSTGIPVERQRLVYNGKELHDSMNINFPSQAIIQLLGPRIYLRLKKRNTTKHSETSYQNQKLKFRDKIVDVTVDIDEPVHILSDSIQRGIKTINAFSAKLFVLGSENRPTISIKDVRQSLSYYGVRNGDSIDVIYESWSSVESVEFEREFGFPQPRREASGKVVVANFNWNEKIRHPHIKGLHLKRGDVVNVIALPDGLTPPGWLYGYHLDLKSGFTWPFSFPCRSKENVNGMDALMGFFPERFVSVVGETNQTDLDPRDTLNMKLPPFRFPPATRMTFRMPISDDDHLYIELTVHYELFSRPSALTRIIITLSCPTHNLLRISWLGMRITLPHCLITDVKVCEKSEIHGKEIQTDPDQKHYIGAVAIESHGATTETQEGLSGKCSTEKRSKSFIMANTSIPDDTIFWSLKAPVKKLHDDGLYGEESITFISTNKPASFKYACQADYIWKGIEKLGVEYVCKI